MNDETYVHHSAAIISLCAGMSSEQLTELAADINDLITAEEDHG